MSTLPATNHPKPGDVLHHPAFGFATIEGADSAGATLRWARQGPSHPLHVGLDALGAVYRRCVPGGLFARSVSDGDAARALLEAEPLAALALLLAEIGEPLEIGDVRDWLLQMRLLSSTRFDAWWEAVRPLAEADERFLLSAGRLSLRPGFAVGDAFETPPRPLPAPGSLAVTGAFDMALRLARGLAQVHVSGAGIVPDRGTVALVGDTVRFRTRATPTGAGRRDDVRFVIRVLLEMLLGPLPSPGNLPDAELAPLLAAAAPELPLELLAVALDALAANPELRPADGMALWERLHVAEAIHAFRAAAPRVPLAAACAGFDTHVGLLKCLQTQVNQDAFLVAGDPSAALLVVADGISQCNAGSGDLAAGLTVRTLGAWWAESGAALCDAEPARLARALETVLDQANSVVCDAALRLARVDDDSFIPMGSTLVTALTRGNRVVLGALGDSRAYLVGRHGAALLTFDQNVQSTRFRDALAGRPTRWGDAGASLVGYVGHFAPEGKPLAAPVFLRTVTLLPGEWLILCSDGLTDYAGAEEAEVGKHMVEAIQQAGGEALPARVMEVCRALVARANRGGGGDNVTVVALTLSSEYGAAPDEGQPPS